jgi:protein-tyrosine phosphatase
MGRFDGKAVIKEASDEFINDIFKISSNRQILHSPLEDYCLDSLKTMQIARIFF